MGEGIYGKNIIFSTVNLPVDFEIVDFRGAHIGLLTSYS